MFEKIDNGYLHNFSKMKKTAVILTLLVGAMVVTYSSDHITNKEVIDTFKISVEDVLVQDVETKLALHDVSSDYTVDVANEEEVDLSTVSEEVYEITEEGEYRLSGVMRGQLKVNAPEAVVKLVLDNVTIENESASAVKIENAKKVVVVLAENSQNNLIVSGENKDATLYSSANMTVFSQLNGELNVSGANEGLIVEQGVILNDANVNIQSGDVAILGQDYLVIRDSNLQIVSEADGLKVETLDEQSSGLVLVDGGEIMVEATQDGIDAGNEFRILNGNVKITAGNGSVNPLDTSSSRKGIKAAERISINGGQITVDAADDAIHSNGDIFIEGGEMVLDSGDDGVHADGDIEMILGEVLINQSYEGMEAVNISISGGFLKINAIDDGLSVAGGVDGDAGERGVDEVFQSEAVMHHLAIFDGEIYINAGGDGVDTNGDARMSGGTLVIDGPIDNKNAAIDYNGKFDMNGGTLIALGSAAMAQSPSETSSQHSLAYELERVVSAGSEVVIRNAGGFEVLIYQAKKDFQSVVYSSDELQVTEGYQLFIDGVEI